MRTLGVVLWAFCLAAACDGGGSGDDDDTGALDRVGDACLPTDVPEGGFRQTEVYLEGPGRECGATVCVVNRLNGDPTETDPSQPTYVSRPS